MRVVDSMRRSLRAQTFSAFALTMLLAGCGGDGGGTQVVVTGIRFVDQPENVGAGVEFTVTVELLKTGDVRADGARDQVTLTLNGTGTLSGTTSVAAVDGLATFAGVTVGQVGPNKQLVASSGSFSASSGGFSVVAGPVNAAQSSVTPAAGNVPAHSLPVPMTFTFKDAAGNVLGNATVSLSTNLAGSTLSPASGTTTAGGAFTTVFRATSVGTATITATVNGSDVVFPVYAVADFCPLQQLAIPATVGGNYPCGTYVAGAYAAATYQFTTPGGASAFSITSSFAPLFEVKNTEAGGEVQLTAQQTPSTVEWWLPAGTYFFRVGSVTGPGTYSVTSAAVAGNSPGVTRVLVKGMTIAGQSLSAGDLTFSDGSFVDAYFVRSTAACSATLTPTGFSPYLAIVDAIEGDEGVDGPPSQAAVGTPISVSSPTCQFGPNPAVVYANSWTGGETGTYTLAFTLTGPGSIRAARIPTELFMPPKLTAASLAKAYQRKLAAMARR